MGIGVCQDVDFNLIIISSSVKLNVEEFMEMDLGIIN